jgi:glycosyltransferase involved in cell wall biosynthesis
MNVVVSIPAYNEERTIERVISDIKHTLKGYSYKVLVVDDGSTDRTAQLAKKSGALVVSHPTNLGLAEAFKTEMEHALKINPDIIVHTDADGQYPAQGIPKLIAKVKEGNQLVLGSRFGRGRYRGGLSKALGNRAFAIVFSNLLRTRITDTTTGFRAFTPTVARLPVINTFTYTQEQLIRARNAKLRIAEVPINARRTRRSRLFTNPMDYALKSWINIMRIYRDFAPLKFFGAFGGFFLLMGLGLSVWILTTLVKTGSVGGIPRVILAAICILTGVQIVLFGFLADMNRR